MAAVVSMILVGLLVQAAPTQKLDPLVAVAKGANVHDLDETLPREALERWLRGLLGPDAPIVWTTSDCGEQTGTAVDRGRDFPTCVEVAVELPNDRKLFLSVVVRAAGANSVSPGRPSFHHAVVIGPEKTDATWLKRLGELPMLIRQR